MGLWGWVPPPPKKTPIFPTTSIEKDLVKHTNSIFGEELDLSFIFFWGNQHSTLREILISKFGSSEILENTGNLVHLPLSFLVRRRESRSVFKSPKTMEKPLLTPISELRIPVTMRSGVYDQYYNINIYRFRIAKKIWNFEYLTLIFVSFCVDLVPEWL